MTGRWLFVIFSVAHLRGWFAAMIALALSVQAHAQQPARFTDATTKLIAAINADDQAAIQQMFSAGMQEFMPPEKAVPFFRGVLAAKGKLQTAGAPEVNGPTANVRVTAAQGDWQFEITLDASDKIAGLRIVPGDDRPGRSESPPAAQAREIDKRYFELRRSNDRTSQLTAERYFNLLRLQEWSDESGKSKVMAKYLEHDPDLKWVKLQAVRGRGAERVVKEVTVPVAKLSKLCQSRVRQIDLLQKRLDELLAKASESDETQPDVGSPMVDERGTEPQPLEPGREEFTETAAPPATPAINHSEVSDDPDPLGFAEVAGTAPPQAAGAGMFPFAGAGFPPGGPGQNADRSQWRTSYAAFAANFSLAASESGEMRLDYGELAQIAPASDGSGDPASESPPAEVTWEAPLQGVRPTEEGVHVEFALPPLPPPLQIQFRVAGDGDREAAEQWSAFAPGQPIRFQGSLRFVGPTMMVVDVREPQPVEATAAGGFAPTPSNPR